MALKVLKTERRHIKSANGKARVVEVGGSFTAIVEGKEHRFVPGKAYDVPSDVLKKHADKFVDAPQSAKADKADKGKKPDDDKK